MVFVPDYSTGLAALGKGFDSFGKAVEGYQKKQTLDALGEAYAANDYGTATKLALQLGDTTTALGLAKLGQGAESAKTATGILSGIYGPSGDTPSSPTPTPGRVADAGGDFGNLNPARGAKAFFESKGLPSHSAAALAANFHVESGFNPGATNPGDGSDGSDSGGIAQWNSDRAVALRNYATANKLDPSKVPTQLAFAWNELQGPEKATLDRLMAAKSLDEAHPAAVGYERPGGWTAANPGGANDYAKRVAVAQRLYGGSASGVRVASADPSFMPQALGYASSDDAGAPLPPPRPTSIGGAPGNPDNAPTAIARASGDDGATDIDPTTTAVVPGDVKAGALQTHLLSSPDGSSQRIAKLAKVMTLPNLSEGMQKVASVFLQRELDNSKLPDAVKQYLFAKSTEGGGFQGGFADFQKKSQDRGETITQTIDARKAKAAELGLDANSEAGRRFVLTGQMADNRGDTLEAQVATRQKLAPQYNLQPGTERYNQFVLNGKLPEIEEAKTPEMKAAEQKMFAGAQEKTRVLNSQIGDLTKALSLNEQVYSGNFVPGVATWAARNLPGQGLGMVDPKRVEASTEFSNLVNGATLSQGKELFGARPTNYDEKLLQELKARPDMTPGERAVVIKNMITHRQQLLEETNQDVSDMRSGTRFQKGPTAAPMPAQGAPQPMLPPPQPAPQAQPGTMVSRSPVGGPSTSVNAGSLPGGPAQPAYPSQNNRPSPQGGAPVRISTPQQAAALPPGTQFVTPDGQVRVRN